MDKFAVYHNIKQGQTIAEQYAAGKETAQILTELAQQLSSRTYRVAVIGEFKRGKSSLVNCILGTELLPTDILPTTAVVNRVVYGTEQKIEIFFKDGTIQITTVEELANYATQKDSALAERIREIVVHYPSVFCQNNIELLDTPGLNDNEFMDKTTMEVLDKIDTAIVTTHASYPVSETEKKLICNLIEQDDIYHLTFVATFIDEVSDDAEDQDRIVELIRRRLSTETYQLFCATHPEDSELRKKAERILCNPVVFAVSSRLAMRGFVRGNKTMLDESRFPHFKYELSALLTANQELDLVMKASRVLKTASENFESWHKAKLDETERSLEEERARLRDAQAYYKKGCPGLSEMLQQMDSQLESDGIVKTGDIKLRKTLVDKVSRIVLRNLFMLEPENGPSRENRIQWQMEQFGHLYAIAQNIVDQKQLVEVDEALKKAASESKELFTENVRLEDNIHDRMEEVHKHCINAEKKCGLSEVPLLDKLENWKKTVPFPSIPFTTEVVMEAFTDEETLNRLRSDDVVSLSQWVQAKLATCLMPLLNQYQEDIKAYIASWRSLILKHNMQVKNDMSEIVEKCAQNIRQLIQQKEAAVLNFETNSSIIKDAQSELNKML